MKANKTPYKILLNDEILNFSINVTSDMLGLESALATL